MNKEDLFLIAQLLQTMKDLAEKLEKDYSEKNVESIEKTKLEILKVQKRIGELL